MIRSAGGGFLHKGCPRSAQDPPGTVTQWLEGRGARIDEVLADYDNTHSPGCAVGVLTDSGLTFARGYGMANLDHGLAITPRTVFRTGSVSKQFTAAVVTLLAMEGVFSFDDGIRRHFPELPGLYEAVTVRHLLHHTSGVRDYLQLMGMRGVGDEATYTEDDVVDLLAKQKALNFSPGSDYRPNRAAGYGSGPDGQFFLDQTTLDIVGDGGVFTNIEDLSLWMANFWELEVGGGGVASPDGDQGGPRHRGHLGLRPGPVVSAPLSTADQTPFLGEYYSEELDVTYRIFREGESLLLDVNGASNLPLKRRGPDTLVAGWLALTYKMEGGLITGFQGGSGRAGGVVFVRR